MKIKEKSFTELLDHTGMTKSKLARALGVTATCVSGWGNNPPRYALAYLELLKEYKKLL